MALLSDLLQLQKKQKTAYNQLINPDIKYLLYGGAVGGGKSYLLRWSCVLYLIHLYIKYKYEKIVVGLFSEDYPTLKDRQIGRMATEFPKQLGKLKDDSIYGLSYHLAPQYGSGIILLRNLDDPSKYLSSEFAGIFVEELTRNNEETFQNLRNRLRYPNIPDVKFMGATNPGGIGHGWVRKLFIDRNTDDPEQALFSYVPSLVYDNKYISETYIKQLESLPEQKRKAYLEGSWDVFAGQVFSEFSRKKHTTTPFIPNKDRVKMFVGGMDWGRAKPFSWHATAIVEKRTDGLVWYRAFTFAECYGIEKSPREWGEEIINTLNMYKLTLNDLAWVKADNQIYNPAQDKDSKSIYDQFISYDKDFRVLQPADKSPRSRILRVETIHNWLSIAPDGLPYWLITENCKNLIRTLPELVYDENNVEDVDTSGDDHAYDGVSYQFRALKWIDARAGNIGQSPNTEKKKQLVNIDMKTGKEVPAIDLDLFGETGTSRVIGG